MKISPINRAVVVSVSLLFVGCYSNCALGQNQGSVALGNGNVPQNTGTPYPQNASQPIVVQNPDGTFTSLNGVMPGSRELAARITAQSAVPTIGIGAGPDCDGQILVFHDLFNLTFSPPAKFSRRKKARG